VKNRECEVKQLLPWKPVTWETHWQRFTREISDFIESLHNHNMMMMMMMMLLQNFTRQSH